VDLKRGETVAEVAPRQFPTLILGFDDPTLTPDGKHLFVNSLEALHHFRPTAGGVEYLDSSPRIVQGAFVNICVSPDSAYVCAPCGGGNYGVGDGTHPAVRPYSTYVYPTGSLKKPAFVLEQGAYPQAVAFDPAHGRIFSQNIDHPVIVFNRNGVKQKEYASNGARFVKQLLPHPKEEKLLLLSDQQLVLVEWPKP
jgi:hypothetical protein